MFRLLLLFFSLLLLPLSAASFAASPTTGDLGGTVRDGKNRPIPNVRVRFAGPSEGSVRTDQNGRYEALDLPPGSYELFFQKPAYDTLHQGNVQVAPNQSRTVNAELAWAEQGVGALEVRVNAKEGGFPLPETTLDLLQNGFPIARTVTDEIGTRVFPGVQPGTYQLLATRAGFRQFRSGRFAVRAGQMTVGALRLTRNREEMGRLGGTVRAPSGVAIRGARVKIVEGYGSAQTSTPATGRYEFGNLIPGGGYALEVSASGFQTQVVRNLVVQAQQLTTRDVTLIPTAPSEGSISGQVVDQEGNGIPHASVTVTAGPDLGREVVAGADGRYSLTNLGAGEFSIVAEANGRYPAGRSGVQVRAGFTAVVDLELLPRTVASGSLTGKARETGSGLPLGEVVVEILGGPSGGLATTSDADGSYLLPDIIPDPNYVVRFRKEGYVTGRQASVEIEAGERATLDVSLAPLQVTTGNLEGTVRRFGAGALADVKVTVFQGPTSPVTTKTDRDGRFAFRGLTAGAGYGIRLEKQGFVTLSRTGITVSAGGTLRLNNLEMSRAAEVGALRVVVIDLAGRPIPGASVNIVEGPTRPPRGTADANGRVTFSGLQSGIYAVEVVANGYQNAGKANIGVSAGRTQETVVQLLRQ